MQAFAPLSTSGWASRVEPEEAVLLAGVFSELSDAMEAEGKRDVLDMMGVNLDGDSAVEAPLMFEKLLGVGTVTSIAARREHHTQPSDSPDQDDAAKEFEAEGSVEEPSEEADSISRRRRDNSETSGTSRAPRGNAPSEPDRQGLTDDQRLAALDFDPLEARPTPTNPYIAAILRPMSQDPVQAAELRALTTPDLAAKKAAAMRVVAAGLTWAADQHTPVIVKPETLKIWVMAINDARLALGWSLGIEDDERAEEVELIADSDPELGIYTAYEITIASIYNALSWWLETLMHAVMGE